MTGYVESDRITSFGGGCFGYLGLGIDQRLQHGLRKTVEEGLNEALQPRAVIGLFPCASAKRPPPSVLGV